MIVGLQQDIQITVAIQVAELALMDALALRGNSFFEISFAIAVPDVYSGIVAGTGIAHLTDEDVQVAVAVDVPDFTGVSVDDLAQYVHFPYVAGPFIPPCLPIHIAGRKDHLRAPALDQLAGGTLCKRHLGINYVFLELAATGMFEPAPSANEIDFTIQIDIHGN